MKNNTIKSWRGQTVRIKREYLKLNEPEIDEDASDYDDDGNIINEVYEKPSYYIDTNNGMNSVLGIGDVYNATFYVQYDCYGVDLFRVREDINISELPEPTHQIIIREAMYPYLWDAKYFEVVKVFKVHTTTEWVIDEEYTH
jgi:hypothetical protein